MPTIDDLDANVYNMYAVRTKMIEQINQEYRLSEASTIPPQIQVVDIYPKLTELDILLGITPMYMPWAYFFPPKKFHSLRRSPFAFSRVLPSLKDKDDEDTEEELEEYECQSKEEQKEKEILQRCLKEIGKINDWMGFIIGRIGQMLQG